MTYRPLFDPHASLSPFDPARADRRGDRSPDAAEQTDRYEYDDDIELAVNVALAAGRPLLVRGRPGTGKSSLARSVARHLGWRYYEATVSSRTTARDLLWTFDTVARLADAQAGPDGLRERSAYVSPGPLWWAFDRELAARRGIPPDDWAQACEQGVRAVADPSPGGDPLRAVVLVDEIDKADPDVPNDLLVPLGSFRFTADESVAVKAATVPLVILTTNDERDLPRAFLRRCVVLSLRDPDPERLRRIVRRHFPDVADVVLKPLLTEYGEATGRRRTDGLPPPSVAELLDAVAAVTGLDSGPSQWPGIVTLLLDKATASPQDP